LPSTQFISLVVIKLGLYHKPDRKIEAYCRLHILTRVSEATMNKSSQTLP